MNNTKMFSKNICFYMVIGQHCTELEPSQEQTAKKKYDFELDPTRVGTGEGCCKPHSKFRVRIKPGISYKQAFTYFDRTHQIPEANLCIHRSMASSTKIEQIWFSTGSYLSLKYNFPPPSIDALKLFTNKKTIGNHGNSFLIHRHLYHLAITFHSPHRYFSPIDSESFAV